MDHISSIILPLCKDLGIEERIILKEVQLKWRSIFGSPVSHHTYPFELKNGELTILVDLPAWLNELKYMQDIILERLSRYNVKSIKLKIGKIRAL
ncbi:MAG: DUF721 domain-containing protein [Thermodesulfovibrionales bacterium]|nr:DUF721 domain-containing protein [Thermodesulfovibrionales bacterium]